MWHLYACVFVLTSWCILRCSLHFPGKQKSCSESVFIHFRRFFTRFLQREFVYHCIIWLFWQRTSSTHMTSPVIMTVLWYLVLQSSQNDLTSGWDMITTLMNYTTYNLDSDRILSVKIAPSLKLTWYLKMDNWKTILSFWGPAYFQGNSRGELVGEQRARRPFVHCHQVGGSLLNVDVGGAMFLEKYLRA